MVMFVKLFAMVVSNGGGVPQLVDAGLVIERLRNVGSTHDTVARRCLLGKDT